MTLLLDLFPAEIRKSGTELFLDCLVDIAKIKERMDRVWERRRTHKVLLEAMVNGVSLSCSCKQLSPQKSCADILLS